MRTNGDGTDNRTNGETADNTLHTVQEAATLLGITPEAVRSRLHRGTLKRHKAEDGAVYVRLDAERTPNDRRENGDETGERAALTEDMREQIGYLRGVIGTRDQELRTRAEELAEMRRIVAALTQRIPQLEVPSEPSQGPETAAEPPERAEAQNGGEAPQTGAQRPWWRRWLGG